MSLFALLGITNDGLNLAVSLLLLFLVVFYAALIYWTYADARRRIADPLIVGCATAASVFPFVGTVVYMIVRPPEYLDDVRERGLEIAAAEARLANVEQQVCPYCSYEVEKSFLRCPSCLRRLKEPCGTCAKPLDPRWPICPFCEAEVGQRGTAQPQRRERPRRRERAPAPDAAEPRPAEPAARPPERERRPARARPAADPQATEVRQASPGAAAPERRPRQAVAAANDLPAAGGAQPDRGGAQPDRRSGEHRTPTSGEHRTPTSGEHRTDDITRAEPRQRPAS